MTALLAGDDLMRSAGAKWCDQHERWECTKTSKRSKGPCHALAVRGTAACYTHAGVATSVAKAKGEAMSAWRAIPGRQDVSPGMAVMAMLQMSWARVHVYAGLLERQVAAADQDRPGGVGQGAGLVGHTFSASPSVGVYESGEAVRALAKLEAEERDRCVRYAKVAHDMGIAEREIRLAESQGALLAGAIRQILDELNLSAAQLARVPDVVPRVLRTIAGEVIS